MNSHMKRYMGQSMWEVASMSSLWALSHVYHPEALWILYFWEFNGVFIMWTWSIINSISSISLFPGPGELGGRFQVLITAWPFWRLTPVMKLCGSPTRVISLIAKTLLSPGKFQEIRSSVSGARVKNQILEPKMLLPFLSLSKLQGF